ncbi:cytochrome P450 78A5 [Prunus yedoensis var. nudiflora]|uniref:Cytochrome P450 78A5 n=1 Tax=Prunus yedoensis var. nudiflora TaxID=2094558 RepID=A0A314XEU1_PRUYE|nr:cytochrome P450 78A5 [Prunus yedoensis var. nudiflora]
MSLEYHLLFIPRMVLQSSFLGFEAFACLFLFMAVFGFWLLPGGLAWAFCKVRAFKAIPGPSGYPLIGSLTVFTGSTRHRVLAKMAKSLKAEALMSFSVGLTRFVISSQPETAKEILNSSAFANRPANETAYELLFYRAMGFAPYGEYWRNLRRIAATHLFSPKRMAGSEVFRREVGFKMAEEIRSLMVEKGEVQMKNVLHFGSLNNVMMTVFGRCYEFGEGGEGHELEKLVREGYELLGLFNWNNHFPFLGWLDLQGVRKRCRILVSKVNAFVGKIIEEHRLKKVKGDNFDTDCSGDFVDVLLAMENDHKLGDSDMIAVLWEMIFRGTDTVATLLEWVLARMVLHPEIQAKAQSEIDSVVGASRPVLGSDVPNLPYLQAIVKECLRVHPPGPLLSWARIAIHDVYVGENFIPARTTAMVNMWAITHDEKVWSEPKLFRPERFMEEEVSIMGTDLRLAPFGSGRRVCPGRALGLASVQLWLAQLLQNFNWVPSEKSDVDLSECLKLSMEMKSPLVCRAVPRFV